MKGEIQNISASQWHAYRKLHATGSAPLYVRQQTNAIYGLLTSAFEKT
jgi:hypothetical protein